MNNYYVYKHTNLINGKSYIGMSCQPTYKRWQESHYQTCINFFAAIQKFGWENFSHEVLSNNLSKEEASKIEKEMISFYKSNQEEFGYNANNGGTGGKTGKSICCIETKIVYPSAHEAGRQTGIAYQNISACCRGRLKSAGGYHWEFVD